VGIVGLASITFDDVDFGLGSVGTLTDGVDIAAYR